MGLIQMKRNARFNLIAPLYDRTMVLAERALKPFRQRLLARATGRVLEIGAGTGATVSYYPRDCHVIAVDCSPAMLRRGVRKAGRIGLRFSPAVMDAQRLAFPDGSFDTVVSSLVMCSLQDPRETLCEARRVLRPGGRVLFLEHVRPSGVLGRVFDAVNIVWRPVVCDLTRRTELLIKEAGFNILEREAPVSFLRILEASPVADEGNCL